MPDQPLAIEWQGTSLLSLGKGDAATEHLQRTLVLTLNRPETHYNLGLLLLGQEKREDDLALRNGAKAVELADRVAQAQPTAQHLETLALSLAEAGRCKEAGRIQKELVALAEKLGNEQICTNVACCGRRS